MRKHRQKTSFPRQRRTAVITVISVSCWWSRQRRKGKSIRAFSRKLFFTALVLEIKLGKCWLRTKEIVHLEKSSEKREKWKFDFLSSFLNAFRCNSFNVSLSFAKYSREIWIFQKISLLLSVVLHPKAFSFPTHNFSFQKVHEHLQLAALLRADLPQLRNRTKKIQQKASNISFMFPLIKTFPDRSWMKVKKLS